MKRFFIIVLTLCLLLAGCQSADAPVGQPIPSSTATTTPVTTVPDVTEPQQLYVQVQREGEISLIPVQQVQGTAGSYTVCMDPAYFVHRGEEGLDEFLYEAWEDTNPVYYSIAAYVGDPQQFVSQMTANYADQYAYVSTEQSEIAGMPATQIVFSGLKTAPQYCHHVYLLDCGTVCYEIHIEITTEMYEGLFAIISACLDTFSITD